MASCQSSGLLNGSDEDFFRREFPAMVAVVYAVSGNRWAAEEHGPGQVNGWSSCSERESEKWVVDGTMVSCVCGENQSGG